MKLNEKILKGLNESVNRMQEPSFLQKMVTVPKVQIETIFIEAFWRKIQDEIPIDKDLYDNLSNNELSKIVIGSKELPEKSIGRFYDNYNKLSAKNFKPILESNNDSLLAIQFDLSGELKDVVLWLAINEGDQNGLPEKYMRKNLAATLSKIANLSKDETEIFKIFVDNLINRK